MENDSQITIHLILNKAVVASKGEYLVFLDGDCIPDNNFVKDHYNLRQHGMVIGGRRVQLPQNYQIC